MHYQNGQGRTLWEGPQPHGGVELDSYPLTLLWFPRGRVLYLASFWEHVLGDLSGGSDPRASW